MLQALPPGWTRTFRLNSQEYEELPD
jgi:hypothetical protein